MKIFSSSLLLMLLSAGLLSCQKESEKPSASEQMNNITASAWVHESSGVDVDRNGTIDLPLTSAGVQTCNLDNALTFNKDGSAIADEGATKCNTADPQTSNFNWNFTDNEASLEIKNNVFAALNGKLKIKTLSSTNLTLIKDTTITSPSTLSVTVVVNLKH